MKTGRRTLLRASRLSDQSGTSAVEFALLSPVFLLILFGMIAYGIYFGASHSLQQIAADAARTAIAGLNEDERQSLVDEFVRRNVKGYPFIDPAKLSVEAADSAVDANQFVVSLRYDARDLPIWNLFSGLPLPQPVITKQTTIRVGGV
jgi:Flp pilus assembly protein TadG